MQRVCPKGHSYAANLDFCPYCNSNNQFNAELNTLGNNAVENLNMSSNSSIRFAENAKGEIFLPENFSSEESFQSNEIPMVDTSHRETTFVSVDQNLKLPPVVGWLVCSEGDDKGKDFRLHADYNYIGRADNQDVCLTDLSVSREHFSVAYDRINNRYFATMGNGKAIVYVNGYPLGKSITVLRKGDKISVGKTTLVFIPLEQQDLKWEWQR